MWRVRRWRAVRGGNVDVRRVVRSLKDECRYRRERGPGAVRRQRSHDRRDVGRGCDVDSASIIR